MAKQWGSYTSQFSNWTPNISYNKPNEQLTELYRNDMTNRYEKRYEMPNQRTLLDRGFDFLLTPNYVVAGAVDGMVRDDRGVFQGAWEGLKAGNPFGQGYEQGETTFSDVLGSAGWNPESTMGKFAKGATGFVLDVALDPTTYLTGGASAIIKGTGRTGRVAEQLTKLGDDVAKVRQANRVDDLVSKGIHPDLAERFAQKKYTDEMANPQNVTHMTEDMAEQIIRRQSAERGWNITPEQLKKDAKNFSDQYNRLQGIRDIGGGEPITWGLSNFPFLGNKEWAKRATWQLSDGQKVRALSDQIGISTQYQRLRAKIYGGKIGKLFSTNAPLWKLAQDDPAKLYDFVKFVDFTKGKNLDKLKSDKAIRDYAKTFDFSPAEQREIIKLLEDKTIWGKVKDNLKFAETKKAEEIRNLMRTAQTSAKAEIDDLLQQRRTAEQMRASVEDQIVQGSKRLDELDEELQEKLATVNLSFVDDQEQLKNIVESMKSEIDRIDERLQASIAKDTELGKTNGIPIEQLDELMEESAKEQAQADEYFKLIENLQQQRDQVAQNKKNAPDNNNVVGDIETEADAVMRAIDDQIIEMKAGKPGMKARYELINTLSNAIYGKEDMLSPTMRGKSLETLVTMFRDGSTAKEVADHIKQNEHLYSPHATEVYKFLAEKYGYKSWADTYHKPKAELDKALRENGDLNPWQYQEWLQLERLRQQRARDFELLFKHMSYDEFKAYRTEMANAEMMDDLYNRINMKLKPSEQLELTDADRASLSTDAFQTVRIGETANYKEVGEVTRNGRTYKVFEVGTKIQQAKGAKTVTKKRYLDSETGEVFRLEYGKMVKTGEGMKRSSVEASSSPKSVQEVLSGEQYQAIYSRVVENYVNAQSRRAGRNLHNMTDVLTRGEAGELIENTVQSVGHVLLENFKGKAFDDLTRGQQDYVVSMAMKHARNPKGASEELRRLQQHALREAQKRAGVARIQAVIDTVKEGSVVHFHDGNRPRSAKVVSIHEGAEGTMYKVEVRGETHEVLARDVKHVTQNKQNMTPEQLVFESKATQDFMKEKEDVLEQIKTYNKQLSDVERAMYENERALVQQYEGFVRNQKQLLEELEQTRKTYDETIQSMDDGKIEELTKKIDEYEELIHNGDALETWVRVHSRSDVELLRDPERYSRLERYSEGEYADGRLGSTGERGARLLDTIDKRVFYGTIKNRIEGHDVLDGMTYDEFIKVVDTPEKMERFIAEHELSHLVNEDWLKGDRDKGNLSDPKTLEIEKRADRDAVNMLKPMGQEYIDDVVERANMTESSRIMLEDVASSDRVARTVRTLRGIFDEIGEKEKTIHKLSDEQFEEMLGRYVPHILTDDGKRYFDEINELQPHKGALTQDLGYGIKWNPYRQSRTIEGKNVLEINDYFRDKLKGKNLFSENIADIYVTRMLKHNELMYDYEYMNEMMHVFGKEIGKDGVEEGYKAVANFGQLRKQITDMVTSLARQEKARGVHINDEWFARAKDMMLKRFNLPSNILEDGATPMIELSEDQVRLLNPFGIVRQVNDVIVHKANQARKLQQAKDEKRFLQLYDKFLHFMKLNQTTVMPSFHIRNKMSNMYLNWLGVGKDAVNPTFQRDAWKTVWHLGDAEKLKDMKPLVSDDGTKVYHWNEIYELAKAHHVIDEGFFAQDVGAGAATKGLFSKKINPKLDPTNTENFVLYRKGAEWGTRIENSDRLIHFASLLKQGKSVDEAGRSSREFLFDYSDLTAFEQSVMKRLFPYYTWLRKNSRLQVSQFMEQPGKFRDTAKSLNAIEGGVPEEEQVSDKYLSDFAKDWVQTPFSSRKEDGSKEPILFNPNLPFLDIGRLPDPTQPLNSVREYMAQMSPQLKVPAELITNRNFFFNNDIVQEGDNPVTPRLAHIARQLALYGAGEKFATTEGVDTGLHALNTFGGIKGLSYDYETSKNMKIGEFLERMEGERTQPAYGATSTTDRYQGNSSEERIKAIQNSNSLSEYERDELAMEEIKRMLLNEGESSIPNEWKEKYKGFIESWISMPNFTQNNLRYWE